MQEAPGLQSSLLFWNVRSNNGANSVALFDTNAIIFQLGHVLPFFLCAEREIKPAKYTITQNSEGGVSFCLCV